MNPLPCVQTSHGDVCIQGGHVTRWRDVLFLSSKSRFEPGQPIRGGIPVIFPWFGGDPAGRGRPAHGFARRTNWRLIDRVESAGSSACTLALTDDESTRAMWPHRFRLEINVVFGRVLDVALTVENRDAHPFRCEPALHTYFSVADIRRTTIAGLEGATFIDKVGGSQRRVQAREPIAFTGEVDRVYASAATCAIDDPGAGRQITIDKDGSRSTIVWNPWVDKTARLGDLAPDDWQRFVCVEAGHVGDDALTIEPGGRHLMRVSIR